MSLRGPEGLTSATFGAAAGSLTSTLAGRELPALATRIGEGSAMVLNSVLNFSSTQLLFGLDAGSGMFEQTRKAIGEEAKKKGWPEDQQKHSAFHISEGYRKPKPEDLHKLL